MAPIDLSPADVRRPGTAWFAGRNPERTVVWCRGEHDLATAGALAETMAWAVARDAAQLVVDLRYVQFMDASTVRVIVRTRGLLGQRSLVLRSPSKGARRLLEVCGLGDLIDPPSIATAPVADGIGALGTWVAVPTTARAGQLAEATAPTRRAEAPLVPAGRVTPQPNVTLIDIQSPDDERSEMGVGLGGP